MNIIDFVLILTNVLVFIVVQTLFFKFIMSRLIIKIVRKNIQKIKHLIPNNIDIKIDDAELQQNKLENEKINLDIIIKNIVYPIIGVILLIILLVLLSIFKKQKWNSYHYILLGMIIFAYITEFLIYFLVVNKYEYLNIYQAIKTILDNQNPDLICILFNRNQNQNNLKKTATNKIGL
jgi:hypothetical protein